MRRWQEKAQEVMRMMTMKKQSSPGRQTQEVMLILIQEVRIEEGEESKGNPPLQR